jgi:enoyl-CoA hydratase/carnithine racemase
VLFGHGDHFSAGLDLAEVGPAAAEHGPQVLYGSHRFDPFGAWREPVPKPVVMAVNGIAFTLSIELALAADIVIAADDVRFRQLEIGRGIVPFGGATFHAPAQLGWGNAMRFLLTAEEFGAAEASRIGLVQEVVSAGAHLQRATELAQLIARQALLVCRPRWPARAPGSAAARTPGATRSHPCSPALCAARMPPKACVASSNGARRTSPATDRFWPAERRCANRSPPRLQVI